MGFLEGEKPLKEEAYEEVLGIERPGLVDMYLDFLDVALTGGVAQIARKAAKRNVLKSLKEFWGGKPGRESWGRVKEQFKPISEALDEIPQSELDYLKNIRTETKPFELNEISPAFMGLLYGSYSPRKEEIVLSSILDRKETRDTLFHELGHSGTIGAAGKGRRLGSQAATRVGSELKKRGGLGYMEDPLEVYANTFSRHFEGLKPGGFTRNERLTKAHMGAAEETWKWMDESYPEELRKILDELARSK